MRRFHLLRRPSAWLGVARRDAPGGPHGGPPHDAPGLPPGVRVRVPLRLARRSAPIAAILSATLAASCATARPEPVEHGPGEGPLILMEPHWDQVCRDARTPLVLRTPSEVLSDPALVREAAALLPDPVRGEPHPHVDVAVNYARSGAIRSVHLAGHNVDPVTADAIEARVASAVHPQGSLLHPVFLRVRVTREPAPVVRILPGLDCLPHISHEEDEPPRFLGEARVGGRLAPSAGGNWVDVRIHLSRTGEVLRLEVLRGDASLLPRVRDAMAETIFDPALINGEPVRGSLVLPFRFPD